MEITEERKEANESKVVDEATLEEAKAIGLEIEEAIKNFKQQDSSKDVLDFAPGSFLKRLEYTSLDEVRKQAGELHQESTVPEGLMGSKFGCSVCTTMTYAGLVTIIGGAIIVSGGMSIPAVLAASGYSISGLATVISAMTGVSTGAVTALLTASGTTLGVVVIGLCEAMGAC